VPEAAWLQVCEPEEASVLSTGDFCSDTIAPGGSPIDDYYEYVEHLLTLGDEVALQASPTLGRLLVLGLVSGVELYFRAILAGLLRCCPICRAHASDQLIPFGTLDYYGSDDVEWGLFDAMSLAGAREIRTRTQKLLAIEIRAGTSISAALDEFDKVCHLRHAAVHSRGTLSRGNAVALGIGRDAGRRTLTISLPALHQAAAACHSVVRAYDRFLFEQTLHRWFGTEMLTGEWESDRRIFKPLFDLVYSRRDALAPSSAYNCYRKLPLARV
jgi:hypothetical protein